DASLPRRAGPTVLQEPLVEGANHLAAGVAVLVLVDIFGDDAAAGADFRPAGLPRRQAEALAHMVLADDRIIAREGMDDEIPVFAELDRQRSIDRPMATRARAQDVVAAHLAAERSGRGAQIGAH